MTIDRSKLRLHVLPTGERAPGADEAMNDLDRRTVIKLLAASASLAGLGPVAGCMQPPSERIMPRVVEPPEMTPGVPLGYATSMIIDGFATGLVVKTLEGRPIKVEGNPEHPASLGATNVFHQASVLELYDPHRPREPLDRGLPMRLDAIIRELAAREQTPGLWFLMHPQSSPLVESLMSRVRARHPGTRFAFYSPLDRRAVYDGARQVFGRPLEAQYRFERADIVVSLDADFMACMPNSVRWARDFAGRRQLKWPLTGATRLYVAEPRPSPTGSIADHRLPVRPSEVHALAAALHEAVTRSRRGATGALSARQARWIDAAADDLIAHRGRAVVVVGDGQPAAVHALGHLINDAIGGIGATVELTRPAIIEPLGDGPSELVDAARAGQVQTLVIIDANPLYSAPRELQLDDLFARIPETLCASLERSETAKRCRWFVPLTHYMESWGDARSYDGTISFIQPLIRPMYGGLSLPELLAVFAGETQPDAHRMLQDRYRPESSDEAQLSWQRDLQRGFVGTSFEPEQVTARDPGGLSKPTGASPSSDAAFEIAFEPSHAVLDGRFASVPWLQELPKPIVKITWGNAAIMSPASAKALDVTNEDVVRLAHGGRQLELPVYVLPGHADRCISVELGYGRTAGGPVAETVGTDVYPLRTIAAPRSLSGVRVSATGSARTIAATQQVFSQHGREIALVADLEHYRQHPDFTAEHWGPTPSLLHSHFEGTPKWGMTIDTMICTGCSACVIACQAENNVPVVGRREVIRNREMHWLRIDTYREEHGDRVSFVHQPMLCQHCENAPCEYVCPTYATQHSPDGLNEMIYNRCVGTRFCSNNCPYKVRRFNWFDYTENTAKPLRLQFNPNVTVRARGVMEKCTYCVQRIRTAEIAARRDNRAIRPGEVVTACQQACPTRAIQFGQLQHEDTDVVKWREQPRHYAVLHDLGTHPRTAYLAKIENPKPGVDK